jgi:purine nucleosidase
VIRSQCLAPPRKIILDCDPGIDDVLAIVFACGHPGLDLCQVTTVAGNVGLALTTANALSVLEFADCQYVPVAAGSRVPLLRPHNDARDVTVNQGWDMHSFRRRGDGPRTCTRPI